MSLVLLAVQSSGHPGGVGDGVILSRHLDEVVLDFVQQGDPAVMTSLLKRLPSQLLLSDRVYRFPASVRYDIGKVYGQDGQAV